MKIEQSSILHRSPALVPRYTCWFSRSHRTWPLVWCDIRGHAKLCLYSSGELDKLTLVIAVMTTV